MSAAQAINTAETHELIARRVSAIREPVQLIRTAAGEILPVGGGHGEPHAVLPPLYPEWSGFNEGMASGFRMSLVRWRMVSRPRRSLSRWRGMACCVFGGRPLVRARRSGN